MPLTFTRENNSKLGVKLYTGQPHYPEKQYWIRHYVDTVVVYYVFERVLQYPFLIIVLIKIKNNL